MLKNLLKDVLKEGMAPAPAAMAPDAAGPSGLSPEDRQAWRDRILAAHADDAALLELAQEAPDVELKAAAIQALTHEESFRRAMRELGERDKRLYRAAKAGLEAAAGRRKASAEAQALIGAARALLEQEAIAVNRAVELDQAWRALNAQWLDASLVTEFAALSEQLGAKARALGEGEQAIVRWLAAVQEAIGKLKAALAEVVQGELSPDGAQPLAAALLELVTAVPAAGEARCEQQADEARRALALAASVVQRAAFLRALPAPGATDEALDKEKVEQWRSIPEVGEAYLQAVLAQRFADWRNAGLHARQLEHDAQRASEQKQRAEQERQRLGALERDVLAAETAHAAGQVAELSRLVARIERALKAGTANAALARRIEALRQAQIHLRDWQRWSGRQGREELVAQAQALERAAGEKVAVKAHAEAIEKLRERWKELDRLGAGSNQSLWLTFDGALKAAYAPVAAHLDKLKAAREENLAARNRIIDELVQAAAKLLPNTPPDWRAIGRTLQEARAAWTKLGPVEHTVPRKAQQGPNGVLARYAAAAKTLQAPLDEAQRAAVHEREQLIAAAKNLVGSGARDLVDQVRALQGQWQARAKAFVLPRREEGALWNAFKAATDAIFAERNAARAAREASLHAEVKAREDIIARVDALASADAAPQIKRGLAEAETAWRAAPRVAGPQAARLEARFRAARDALNRRLGGLAASASRARFDALIAATALCNELEAADAPPPDAEPRLNAVENLPEAWKAKLQARLAGTGADRARLPETLLQLEVACGLDSPAEVAAERQRLKLRALKEAMENRRPVAHTREDIERWLLDAAATARPDGASRARLEKILSAARAQAR